MGENNTQTTLKGCGVQIGHNKLKTGCEVVTTEKIRHNQLGAKCALAEVWKHSECF